MLEINKFIYQLIFTLLFVLILIYNKKIIPLKINIYIYNLKKKKEFYKYLKKRYENKEKTTEDIKDDLILVKIRFFDVFSNEEMNKMIKSLKRFKKKDFKLDMNWRNNKIRNIDYIDTIYKDFESWYDIVTIFPKNEKHITKIAICGKQINNEEFVVDFRLNVNPLFENIFINRNFKLGGKNPFFQEFSNLFLDNEHKEKIMSEYILNLYQAYISNKLKLNYGKTYILPTFFYFQNNKLDIDNPERHFLVELYIDPEKKSVSYKCLDKSFDYSLYICFKKYIPKIAEGKNFDNLLYYTLFYEIERREMKLRFNKYFNSKKRKIKNKDFIWLINKLRTFDDYKRYEIKNKFENIEKYEYIYEKKERKKVLLSDKEKRNNLEEEYKAIYEYLKTIYSQQKEYKTINIALFTVILTILFDDKFLNLLKLFLKFVNQIKNLVFA